MEGKEKEIVKKSVNLGFKEFPRPLKYEKGGMNAVLLCILKKYVRT